MKFNVRLLSICIIACSMFLGINQAFASHAAGADLTYTCLGNNQYQISLSFYRDCDGISAPTSASVSITSSCGSVSSVNLTRQSSTGVEVSQLCPSQIGSSTCNGGNLPGIEQYTYVGNVTLNTPCNDWTVSYSLCCRNSAVTNLNDADSYDLYVESVINNTNGLCNNSPIFTSLPVPYLCNNSQFFYNHGAVDVDGDSLFYTMVQPRDAGSVNVPYNAGFSVANPMNTSSGFGFDPLTGQMDAVPTGGLQNAVIAVRVDEYRGNQLIGSVIRDMQFITINCNTNTPPTVIGPNGGTGASSFTVEFCAGVPNCFDINATDPDNAQTLTMTWNSGIPGASFTTSGGSRPTGTFCWTPSVNDLGSNTFTVTVRDGACPTEGVQVVNVTVLVGGLNVNLGPDTTLCAASYELTPSISNGSGVLNYNWSTGDQTPNITVTQSGQYSITVTDSVGCEGIDTVNVTISQTGGLDLIAATDTTVCPGEAVTFDAGAGFASYLWSNGATTQDITVTDAGVYTVTVADADGCQNIDSIELINANNLVVDLGPDDTICANETLILDAGAGNAFYFWSTGDTTQTIEVGLAGSYDVTIVDALGCTASDTFNLFTLPVPTVNLGPDRITCQPPFRLAYRSSGAQTLLWSTGETTATIFVQTTGTYALSVTDANGCVGVDSISIAFTNEVDLITWEDTTLCAGETLTIDAFSGFSAYLWSTGETTEDIDVTTAGTYTLRVEDQFGCVQTDTVVVNFNAAPQIGLGSNVAVCDSLNVSELLDAGAGFASYLWSTGDTTQTITATAIGNYSVTVTDAIGCAGSDAVDVFVAPTPVANLGGDDTICVGATAVLSPGNFASYDWSDGSTGATLAVNGAGVYSVTVTDANGCTATDEVEIATELCCFPASFGNQFTLIDATNNTITADAVWEGKYYVTTNVIVSGSATLDLTNVDLVFLEDAGIRFTDFSRVRANNSVFRACDEGQSWLGFDFLDNSSGNIDESTFLGATVGVDVTSAGSVNVTSSEFRNSRIGIRLNGAGDGDYKGAITNNVFVTNDAMPDYRTNTGAAVTSFFGVQATNTLSSGLISQNEFINSIQDNTDDEFHGVYVNNSRVSISANTFTNLFRAVDVTGQEFVTIENNDIEYTFRSYEELYAVRTSFASTVLIQGNEFDYSVLGSTPTGAGWLQTAVFVANSDNIIIDNNEFYGFTRTIRVNQNSSFVSVTSNLVDGAKEIGILMRNGNNYECTGNTVTNSSVTGIYVFNIDNNLIVNDNDIDGAEVGIRFTADANTNLNSSSIEIFDNCVANTETAILLSTVNTTDVPAVNNNYLYNYTAHGIWSSNFTGTIGDCANYPADAGRNSFVSNYLAPFGTAMDVRSDNQVLLVQGNSANLVTNFPNVLVNTACNTTSNAGCGNQIGNNEGGGRMASPLVMMSRNLEAAYPLSLNADNFVVGAVTELGNVAAAKRLDYAVNVMYILAANADATELTKFFNNLNGVLNANEMNWAAYVYNSLKGDYTAAKGFLNSYTATTADAQDMKVIEGIRVQLNMDGRNITELTANEVNVLKTIDDERRTNAAIARDMLQAGMGEHDYIFETEDIEDLPNNGAATSISLEEDFLNIYPNPAIDKLTIQYNTSSDLENTSLIITDVLGRQVFSTGLEFENGEVDVDVTAMPSGAYIVSLINGKEVVTHAKLIKK